MYFHLQPLTLIARQIDRRQHPHSHILRSQALLGPQRYTTRNNPSAKRRERCSFKKTTSQQKGESSPRNVDTAHVRCLPLCFSLARPHKDHLSCQLRQPLDAGDHGRSSRPGPAASTRATIRAAGGHGRRLSPGGPPQTTVIALQITTTGRRSSLLPCLPLPYTLSGCCSSSTHASLSHTNTLAAFPSASRIAKKRAGRNDSLFHLTMGRTLLLVGHDQEYIPLLYTCISL